MSGTVTALPEARQYIDEVRAHLGDMAADDRDELLADVEVSVHEAAAEDPDAILSRLGTPAAFAAELRAAAGYPPAPATTGRDGVSALQRLRRAAERFTADPRVRELAPVWWVARGYVAVAVLALLSGGGFAGRQPLLPTPSAPLPSFLLLVAAVVASVWLGLRRTTGRRLTAANAVLAAAAPLVALSVLADPHLRAPDPVFYSHPTESHEGAGLLNDGVPVQNLYVYTRDGRLVLDALIYDANGNPVEVPSVPGADPHRRPVVDRRGREIFNAFPIRYFEPGTRRIERPRAAPPADLPRIVTPPPTEQRLRR